MEKITTWRVEFSLYQPPSGTPSPTWHVLQSSPEWESWHDHVRGDGCCYAGSAGIPTLEQFPGETKAQLMLRAQHVLCSLTKNEGGHHEREDKRRR